MTDIAPIVELLDAILFALLFASGGVYLIAGIVLFK